MFSIHILFYSLDATALLPMPQSRCCMNWPHSWSHSYNHKCRVVVAILRTTDVSTWFAFSTRLGGRDYMLLNKRKQTSWEKKMPGHHSDKQNNFVLVSWSVRPWDCIVPQNGKLRRWANWTWGRRPSCTQLCTQDQTLSSSANTSISFSLPKTAASSATDVPTPWFSLMLLPLNALKQHHAILF